PRDGPYSADRAKALADLFVQPVLIAFVVAVQRRADMEDDDVSRVESDIHLPKVLQRSEKQSGADEYDERDGHLGDHERLAEARARIADRPAVLFERMIDVARRAKRRQDSE